MGFITKFLNNLGESCAEVLGIFGCIFIYLTMFGKARKNWSIRKEMGILMLVSIGIAMTVAFLEALLSI